MSESEEKTSKKKGKKKCVMINLRYTKYPLIKKCALEMGWKITKSREENLIFWCDNEGGSDLAASLKRYQFYNHFPGMSGIAHKVELSKNMDRMSRSLPDIYNFHPKTYIIPGSFNDLQHFMQSIPKKANRTFIIKPDTGCQGRGIKLIQDPKLVEDYDGSAVAQQYIEPFLVDGYKFDLRIYALVTCIEPLRIYMLKEGMARFCTEPYHKPKAANLDDCYSHLTNFSLNKNSELFQANEKDIAPETGSKRTMTSVFKKIKESGGDVEKIKEKIHRIINLTLISIQPHLNSMYHTTVASNDRKSRCFEILGFDILINSELEPRLIEVNTMPSLSTGSPFDEALKKSCVMGAMKIINLKASYKTQCQQQMKNFLYSKATPKATLPYDPNEETEISKTTDWELIFPVNKETESGKAFMELADKAFEVAISGMSRNTKTSQIRKEMIDKQKSTTNEKKILISKPQQAKSALGIETGHIYREPHTATSSTKCLPRVTEDIKPKRIITTAPKVQRKVISGNSKATLYHPRTSRAPSFVIEKRTYQRMVITPTESTSVFSMMRTQFIKTEEEYERHKYLKRQQLLADSSGMLQYIRMMIKSMPDPQKDQPNKEIQINPPQFQVFVNRTAKM